MLGEVALMVNPVADLFVTELIVHPPLGAPRKSEKPFSTEIETAVVEFVTTPPAMVGLAIRLVSKAVPVTVIFTVLRYPTVPPAYLPPFTLPSTAELTETAVIAGFGGFGAAAPDVVVRSANGIAATTAPTMNLRIMGSPFPVHLRGRARS